MSASILIVEDEILVALEMEAILEDHGYHIVGIAADLEGALAYADRRIDLALVDLNLRDGATGPEIGMRLANEHKAHVLFVTANPRQLGNGIAGTVGVLTKPTDKVSLTGAVAYALARSRGEQVPAPDSLRCFN